LAEGSGLVERLGLDGVDLGDGLLEVADPVGQRQTLSSTPDA